MQSGLYTQSSLFAIAIISSCLFCLVASENAKNAATSQLHAEAADERIPLPPLEKKVHIVRRADVDISETKTGKTNSNDENENMKNEKFLRDSLNKVEKSQSVRYTYICPATASSSANVFNIHNSDVSVKASRSYVTKVLLNPSDSNDADEISSVDKKNDINGDNGIFNGDNGEVNDKVIAGNGGGPINIVNANDPDGHQTNSMRQDSLPNIITDIPAVTVTELPLEVLQPMQGSLNAIIVDASNKKSNTEDAENRTVDVLEGNNQESQQGEQVIKINDSGGGLGDPVADDNPILEAPSEFSTKKIINENSTETATGATLSPSTLEQQQQDSSQSTSTDSSGTVNLTNEEVPMPVFSEWAQKQMEAAEKQQQAKDQEVVNTFGQKKNLTNGSKKLPPLKMRAKNYASPDCGAKIIASNADATNTGAVLSSSKDEYMLSPCGNRIWFVVELCEAIQAQKVDLANFELFSSSPKNFTVAVSNRFPTREWSNVGRFVAEDKRNVQSFDLHPHLFGKFVRLDIHSHHSQEHFCPVSLFRVFGTSEIEAFETENHPDDDLDEFEDDIYGVGAIDQANVQISDNIFKSASDAVMSMVKKAAEVLVKPSNNKNRTTHEHTQNMTRQLCRSFMYGEFNCASCTPILVQRINNILSCEFQTLENLLAVQRLRSDLLNTQICTKQFGVDAKVLNNDCSIYQQPKHHTESFAKRSYYINLLPTEYIGALCYTLSGSTVTVNDQMATYESQKDEKIALNLTIDKKLKTKDIKVLNDVDSKKIVTQHNKNSNINIPETEFKEYKTPSLASSTEELSLEAITESNIIETPQLKRPQEEMDKGEQLTSATSTQSEDAGTAEPTVAPDVNIFNIIAKTTETENETNEHGDIPKTANKNLENNAEGSPNDIQSTNAVDSMEKTDDDVAANIAWDNLDGLLPTTMSPGSNVVGNNVQNSGSGINSQQKIPGSPQSESIFMRLSNRIKTLERNMSLSGQYLEELSRRYKKQVEELQVVLTQQSQTIRNLEDQNRRHVALQELFEQSNMLLKSELDNMALQVHACIVVVIVVGAFVLLLLVVSILFFRALWHRNKGPNATNNRKIINQQKLARRKSFDEYSEHSSEKMRRPSEEVTDILKKHLDIPEGHRNCVDKIVQTQPQRKMSVCYVGGSNHHLPNPQEPIAKSKMSNVKRKNAKSSWSSPDDTRQIALEKLEKMRGMDVTLEEYKKANKTEKSPKDRPKVPDTPPQAATNGSGKSKKKSQNYRRQDSAPAICENDETQNPKTTARNEFGESLVLDEEDLDNFIPNSDLAYNEFMPEGPSGYQIIDNNDGDANEKKTCRETNNENTGKKKSRRLSSPGFFKTSFSKALMGKSLGSSNNSALSPTSWEWHRLKNTDIGKNSQFHNSQSQSSVELLLRDSPATRSLEASTLSEIHFPTNSTSNSFRILEEAILSSGETVVDRSPTAAQTAAAFSNGKHSHSTTSSISGGSNSSQRSSISNSTSSSSSTKATKKKRRGFQRILRKVF